jgi:hypothetical protein
VIVSRRGWLSVTRPAASSTAARIAISSGDFAPRLKFAHFAHVAVSGATWAPSTAIAQTRSHGMVAPAASSTAPSASTPCPLTGWRQRWVTRTGYPAFLSFFSGPRMFSSRFGFTPWVRMIVYCWRKVMVLFATQ